MEWGKLSWHLFFHSLSDRIKKIFRNVRMCVVLKLELKINHYECQKLYIIEVNILL